MTSQLSIVEKTSIFFNEMIHIMFGCVVHLHCYRNKVMPLMKPSTLANFSNSAKFRNYTCWSTNDIRNHCLSCLVNNHHIGNKNLILTRHVKIDL
jgi:hypothetical protein